MTKLLELSDGGSYAIDLCSFFTVKTFVRCASSSPQVVTELVSRHEDGKVIVSGSELFNVIELSEPVDILVRSAQNQPLPKGFEVTVTIEQPEASSAVAVDLPTVRLDGLAQQIVGTLEPFAGDHQVLVGAPSSASGRELTRSIDPTITFLRSVTKSIPQGEQVKVFYDITATSAETITPETARDIESVVSQFSEVAEYGIRPNDVSRVYEKIRRGRFCIGSERSRKNVGESNAKYNLVITDSPRPSLLSGNGECSLLVYGPNAAQEKYLFTSSYHNNDNKTVHVVALEDLLAQLRIPQDDLDVVDGEVVE